jgi:hypothetical protein
MATFVWPNRKRKLELHEAIVARFMNIYCGPENNGQRKREIGHALRSRSDEQLASSAMEMWEVRDPAFDRKKLIGAVASYRATFTGKSS